MMKAARVLSVIAFLVGSSVHAERVSHNSPSGASHPQVHDIIPSSGYVVSSQALQAFVSENAEEISERLARGEFSEVTVQAKDAWVDGKQWLLSQRTLAVLSQILDSPWRESFSVPELLAMLMTVSLRDTNNDPDMAQAKFDLENAIAFGILRQMDSERLMSMDQSSCGHCGTHQSRPVFPLLNAAARAAVFPFRAAANIIRNGIAFRQYLRSERYARGLTVAQIQSLPYLRDRIAARVERRQSGLALIPGPRRLGNRIFGRR